MKILNINWLSKEALEAEIEVSDGMHKMTVFSCPCEYENNQEINEYIHPLEVENFRKSFKSDIQIIKLSHSFFSYQIIGKIEKVPDGIISVGNLKFELSNSIPSWAEEGEIVEFESVSFDLW